jgi:5,10-methylenetetrahydromethanopterin reductase
MQDAWRKAGRDVASLSAVANTAGCVLREGEAADSPRAKAQAGPTAMIALHSLVERDEFGDLGRPLPAGLTPLLDRYREIYRRYEPADARYLSNHRGHLMFLRPEEHEVCTADLIKGATLTGTREEIRERIREMAKAGYTNLGVTIRYGHPEMLEDWSDVIAGV